jgi:hypothetical protein
MGIFRLVFVTAFIGISLLGSAWDAGSAERRNPCRGGDRIRIQDLDVSPDPLIEGERIRGWRVRVRLDGNRDCETEIEIREGNEVVAQGDYLLRPGINEIQLKPLERYRFHRGQHCFEVVVDLEGTRRRVDADREFCARQSPAWSMRERDLRGRPPR